MIAPFQPGDRVDYKPLSPTCAPQDFRTNGIVESCRYSTTKHCWVTRVRWPKAESPEWLGRGVLGVGHYAASKLKRVEVATEQDLIDAGQAWRRNLDARYEAAVDQAVTDLTSTALEGMRWQAQVRSADGYAAYREESDAVDAWSTRISERVREAMQRRLMDEESGE